MKIWETHARQLGRDADLSTTADGQADVAGVVFTERAYLLALRAFRPAQLVKLCAEGRVEKLLQHFKDPVKLNENSGRCLVEVADRLRSSIICRSDEVGQEPVPALPKRVPPRERTPIVLGRN